MVTGTDMATDMVTAPPNRRSAKAYSPVYSVNVVRPDTHDYQRCCTAQNKKVQPKAVFYFGPPAKHKSQKKYSRPYFCKRHKRAYQFCAGAAYHRLPQSGK